MIVSTNIHRIVKLEIVKRKGQDEARWLQFVFEDSKMNVYELTAFLEPDVIMTIEGRETLFNPN
jgi:hypothetical protein